MRWKKRHVKRFQKIVETYYSKNSDIMLLLVSVDSNPRKFPSGLLVNRRCKNHYEKVDYSQASLILTRKFNSPYYVYSKVKRSRVKGIISGYAIHGIETLNEVFGTDYTNECVENYRKYLKLIKRT